MLQIRNLRKSFGDLQVLKSIDLDVNKGDVVAILGPSGSGKTTMLRCLNFLEKSDGGTMLFDDQRVDLARVTHAEANALRRRTGFVFQSYNLFANKTALQNVTEGLIIARKMPRRRAEEIARAALVKVGMDDRADYYPSQLSGGQQQRVALARILANEPRALLLDEPFSALDSYLKYQLELELAETLGGFPGTVLWVSHDRGEVFRNCRRVCVIDRGRSQPVTTLGELFRSPGTEAAARLSGCKNYADARPREDAVFLPDWGLTLSCGRPVPEGVCRIGIRAHHVQLAGPGAENAFSCTAVKVVEDVFSTIVLLRPEGAAPEAPLLRMELGKDNWQAVPDKDRLTVSVPPEAILLLES